jgi:hypothetical protein
LITSFTSTGYLCWKKHKPVEDLEKHIDYLVQEIQKEQSHFEIGEKGSSNLFSGTVFVIFNDIKCYDKFYNVFPHSVYFLLYNKIKYLCERLFTFNMASRKKLEVMDSIRVVNTSEPAGDVLWENLHYSPLQRVVRAIWVYIVSIFLIGVSFGAIIGLTYLQKKLKDEFKNKSNSSYNKTGYSILISIIITIINFMITLCLNKLSE